MKLVAHGETHPGYVRNNNEDAFLILPEYALAVVADGMAGHRFGELASAIAINTIRRFYQSAELDRLLEAQFSRAKKANLEPRTASYDQFKLRRALEEANLAIFNTARRNPQYETMGTTIVAIAVRDSSLFVAHVGDSRGYRLRRDALEPITQDHSLFNEYVRLNYLSKEDADSFPLRNVIVRALGLQEAVEVETGKKTARVGDTLLLCTDGLTDCVREADIAAILQEGGGPDEQVRRLIGRTLNLGAPDNVTAVIVRLEDGE